MSTSEQARYGSHLYVENKPFFSLGEDINSDPEALWRQFEEKGEILARINHEWRIVYPANQCVPEQGEGVHVMWSIRDPRQFHTPQTLSEERLSPSMRMALQFIDLPRGVAGYNISEDTTLLIQDARRKPTPQTWRNLHIHGLQLPQHESLQPIERKADSPIEPIILEEVFREFFSTFSYHGFATHSSPVEQGIFSFPIRDKSILRLRPDITPAELAVVTREIDWLYRAFHRELFSCYVANYVAVAQSGWHDPYTLLPRDEMHRRITQFISAGTQQKRLLTLYAHMLREEEMTVSAEKRFYKSPSYSVALFKQDENPYLVIHPHLLRNMNVLGTVGFRLDRTIREDVMMEQRHARIAALLKEHEQEWDLAVIPSFLDK